MTLRHQLLEFYTNFSQKLKLIHLLLATTLICIFFTIMQSSFLDNWKFIKSDGYGYYSYLPGIFIHHSVDLKYTLSDELNLPQEDLPEEYTGLRRQENGKYLNKYPLGTALLQAPFYFTADLLTRLTGFEQNGYSVIYQWANFISALTYLNLALIFIYKLLIRRFAKSISLLTLTILILGTNLLHYSTYEASFSHVYSLALISLFFVILSDPSRLKNYKTCSILGIILGLIILIRNTNAIVILMPIFLLLNQLRSDKNFIRFIVSLTLIIIPVAILLIPQFIYWHAITGSFLINSYQQEGFNFLNPQFKQVLFSIHNGLFFWHPLLLAAIPGWFYAVFRKQDRQLAVMLVITLLTFYLISSWWAWWFGFSFGHRGFTDYYQIFALGLAYSLYLLQKEKNLLLFRLLPGVTIILLLGLNLIQLNHYWRGISWSGNITMEGYLQTFFRPCLDVPFQAFRCD